MAAQKGKKTAVRRRRERKNTVYVDLLSVTLIMILLNGVITLKLKGIIMR